MTSNAPTDWPRAYLLQIHDEAVKNGMIWIEPISATDAKSLRQRLYRVRRRSDKALAAYILPEYHLVTVGEWVEISNGIGRLPIIYNRTASGKALPSIRPATVEEMDPAAIAPGLPDASPIDPDVLLANIEAADLTLDKSEVDNFVQDLIDSAKKKAKKAAEDE